ncbi:hypothetical protein CHUAL_012875 [Chamberlinius hualienensis]
MFISSAVLPSDLIELPRPRVSESVWWLCDNLQFTNFIYFQFLQVLNMSQPGGFYGSDSGWANQPEGYSFDMSGADFAEEQQFGTFDYNSGGQSAPISASPYTGSIMTPQVSYDSRAVNASGPTNFDDEPPLMEELGINFDHIMQKVFLVVMETCKIRKWSKLL